MFDHPDYDAHEKVLMVEDAASGLKAIIAVHSTALGAAAGGCRLWAYDSGVAALGDALRLSRGMSYKNAMANLPMGGGKAVILGPVLPDRRIPHRPVPFCLPIPVLVLLVGSGSGLLADQFRFRFLADRFIFWFACQSVPVLICLPVPVPVPCRF